MGAAEAYIFQRVEKKYLMDSDTYAKLTECLEPYMQIDEYGLHTISNIYYDTENYDLIRTSLDKPVYKEKLRLRSYGTPVDRTNVFIEIKKKYKGIVYKRRVRLPYIQAINYLNGHIYPPTTDSQILHEIDYFIKFYQPIPKLLLSYDRIAMFGRHDPDFRITFDQNIRSRDTDLDLRQGSEGQLLFNSSMYLMEIKINGAIPLWLSQIMTDLKIYPISFSKYGTIYAKNHSTLID